MSTNWSDDQPAAVPVTFESWIKFNWTTRLLTLSVGSQPIVAPYQWQVPLSRVELRRRAVPTLTGGNWSKFRYVPISSVPIYRRLVPIYRCVPISLERSYYVPISYLSARSCYVPISSVPARSYLSARSHYSMLRCYFVGSYRFVHTMLLVLYCQTRFSESCFNPEIDFSKSRCSY